MPPELQLVRQWLERAAVDLRSAEVVLSADPPEPSLPRIDHHLDVLVSGVVEEVDRVGEGI